MSPFFHILLAVVFISFSAQLTIPLPIIDIPITGQSLAVLVVAGILPWRYSSLSILVYLFLGTVGLPVFAAGTAGWEKIVGNSGGFLLGFIPAAFGMSLLVEKGRTWSKWKCLFNKHKGGYWFLYLLLLMMLGTTIILACGIARLSMSFGLAKALEYGFYPFIAGAIIKIIVGAILVYFIRPIKTDNKIKPISPSSL